MFNTRKRIVALTLAAALAGVTFFAASPGQPVHQAAIQRAAAGAKAPAISSVIKVGMTVSDLDRSITFYHDVLNFQKISEREVAGKELELETGVFGLRCRIADMQLGDETIELTQYLASPGRTYPAESRSNDRWFQHIAIITSDMDQAYARLRANKVQHASTGPQTLPEWNKNAAGIQAFYFRDPDGHVLETLQFPADKGREQWQSHDRLFLGIDHTAIVVADTDKSLAFYRDLCGMTIAGSGENYGDEQEHLNNVQGAHLRITTLRSAAGPAVELLEYLTPRDGKPYPADEKPNDIVHWQTTVTVGDASRMHAAIAGWAGPIVEVGGSATFLARDPDGHVMEIQEKK